MVVTLGQQYNIGGKPITLYTYINRQKTEKQRKKQKQNKTWYIVLGAFRFFFKHDKRRTRPQEECFVRSVVLDAHDLG